MSDVTQRQIFYFNGNDRLMAANTTDDEDWHPSYEIPEADPGTPGSMALSVEIDTKTQDTGLDGIRVYYPSSIYNRIQEVGMDFWESETYIWHSWAYFDRSDANSGVAAAYSNDETHVYMRNATTNRIEEWTWNYYDQYVNEGGGWNKR